MQIMGGLMNIAKIVGQAVSTIKHVTMKGTRLLLAQMVNEAGKEDGEPVLVIDTLGAAAGSLVILTSDGAAARELVKAKNSPVRWMVLGLCDQ